MIYGRAWSCPTGATQARRIIGRSAPASLACAGEAGKRGTEADQRLRRLYDAIESGVADITDPALKERIDGLKAIRDQAQADAVRAQSSLATSGEDAVMPAMVARFADIARKRMRLEGGGYRRNHLRALAQRVEVGAKKVRIIGSKGDLLRTLAAVSGGNRLRSGCPVWD